MTVSIRWLVSALFVLTVGCADDTSELSSESADGGVPVRVWSSDAGDRRGDAGATRRDAGTRRNDAGEADAGTNADPVPSAGDAGAVPTPVESVPPPPMAQPPAATPAVPPTPEPAAPPPPPAVAPVDAGVMNVVPPSVGDAGTGGGPSAPTAPSLDAGLPSVPVVDAGTPPVAVVCIPGLYRGPFRGQLVDEPTNLAIEGTVSWRLVLDTGGDSLQLRDGKVEAQDPFGTPIVGTVTGWVDCVSKQLRDGILKGSYGPSGAPQSQAFSGAVTGRYAPEKPSLEGTWSAAPPGLSEQASGSYQTSLVP